MIVEELKNWRNVFQGPVWTKVFEALERLTPETPEGETQLQGDDVFMRVMSYETRAPEQGVLEAHREYIDVQAAIVNSERIDWFPADTLAVKTPYDAAKDVVFFERPGAAPVQVDVFSGRFCVLFPADAHAPQMMTGPAAVTVKKAVVKVRASLVGKME